MIASTTTDEAAVIRGLNDRLRQTLTGGKVTVTQGIMRLAPELRASLVRQMMSFTTFTADNDPDGEHDFGSITADSITAFWKIDYYDLTLERGSPDPSDPAVTTRVLTLLLAEEY